MSYATVAELRQYLDQVPTTAEQIVTLSGATAGTWVLRYDAQTTAALAFNASATTVKAALLALAVFATVPPSALSVRGRRGGPYRILVEPPLGDDAEFFETTSSLTPSAATIAVVSASETLLQQTLDRATSHIDAALDPVIFDGYSVLEARRVRGYGSTVLTLPPHAPGSVTAVSFGGTAITNYSGQADRTLFLDGTLIGSYDVTARWGYGPPPASIVQLCLEMAVNIWRLRDKGLFTEIVGTEGGSSVRYLGGLNRTQTGLIEATKSRLLEQAI